MKKTRSKKSRDTVLLRLTHVGLSTGVSSSSYSRKPFPSRFLLTKIQNTGTEFCEESKSFRENIVRKANEKPMKKLDER
jgi:hypothetical protein